jgi:hypothetical protein
VRAAIIFAWLIFGLALATGSLAQTPTAPTTPASPSSSLQGLREAHPDWFATKNSYFPCPSSVRLNGRGACLGCPTVCSRHY